MKNTAPGAAYPQFSKKYGGDRRRMRHIRHGDGKEAFFTLGELDDIVKPDSPVRRLTGK